MERLDHNYMRLALKAQANCRATLSLLVSVVLTITAIPALAQRRCLDDSGKPPSAAVTGRLSERSNRSYKQLLPAVNERFYILDLDAPTCLNRANGSIMADIRSVHVYSKDERGTRLLKQHKNKRVTVRFIRVFEEHTAHHRRPMVGEVESVVSLP